MTDSITDRQLWTPTRSLAERHWIPVLHNSIAGPCDRSDSAAGLCAELAKNGFDATLFADRQEFLAALEKPDFREQLRCVVAGGGDGTVRWVINQCPQLPIAIFPLGSENLLARHLGITRDIPSLARMITAGVTRRLDLGRLNDSLFCLMASSGLDSAVVQQLHEERRGHITRWTYAQIIARQLAYSSHPTLTVTMDGETVEGAHVFVFNLPEYAFRMPLAPKATATDHLLDVLVLRRPGPYHLARYFAGLFGGWLDQMDDVFRRQVRSVTISSPTPATIQSDGDPGGQLPATIAIMPEALEVFVPDSPLLISDPS